MNSLDISFKKEVYESDFYYNLLKKEFENIIYNSNIRNKSLYIFSSYSYENEYEIEFGVYIINTSSEDILVNNIPICLYDDNNKIYSEEIYINKNIEGFSARFKEVKFKKEKINKDYNFKNLSISIDKINSIKKFPYINIEIDNIPKIKEYVNYKDMKKFLKNIPIMKENQLAIDIFRVGEIEEGFYIIALFRNSSNREINIKSIPITVENNINLLIYKGIFNVNDNSLEIKGESGKIKVIIIPRNEFPFIEGEIIEEYNVKIE